MATIVYNITPGQTRERLEQPVGDVRTVIARKTEFRRQTVQVGNRLGGHVIKVGQMSRRVQHGEEEGRAGADLVKLKMAVQRNVLMQRMFFHLCDQVPAHRQKQEAVTKGQGGRRTPSDCDPNPHDVPKIQVLRHERIKNEPFDEQSDGDNVKDEQEENVLPVLLQEVGQGVPLLEPLVAVPLSNRVHPKTLHPEIKTFHNCGTQKKAKQNVTSRR